MSDDPPQPAYPPPPPLDLDRLPPERELPRPPGTNGFAIASFATAFVAPLCGGLPSIIFGIIALVQISKSRQRGRGFAIAGFSIVGGYIVAFFVFIAIMLAVADPIRGSDGEIVRSGTLSLDRLAVGDCISDIEGGTQLRAPVTPCDAPHDAEVFSVHNLRLDGPYPGDENIRAEARLSCRVQLSAYSRSAYQDDSVEVRMYYPSEARWSAGDREVICIAAFRDGKRSGRLTR